MRPDDGGFEFYKFENVTSVTFLENPLTSVDLQADLPVLNLHLYKVKLEPLY